mgnify:CR=1 FL=1
MTERRRWPLWALRLGGGLALLALWDLGASLSHNLLLPRPGPTLVALAHLVFDPALWRALAISNQALALGFLGAALVGVPLGCVAGHWPRAGRWLDPYVNVLVVLPTPVLPPVIFMLMPPGLWARALVVALFALPIVVQYAETGVRRVDARLRDVARVFGATPLQAWRRVLLPAAAPDLLLGLRLGLSRALEGMVVVELLIMAVGVGQLLQDYQARFESPSMYAVILVLMAESALLARLGRTLEGRRQRLSVAA